MLVCYDERLLPAQLLAMAAVLLLLRLVMVALAAVMVAFGHGGCGVVAAVVVLVFSNTPSKPF